MLCSPANRPLNSFSVDAAERWANRGGGFARLSNGTLRSSERVRVRGTAMWFSFCVMIQAFGAHGQSMPLNSLSANSEWNGRRCSRPRSRKLESSCDRDAGRPREMARPQPRRTALVRGFEIPGIQTTRTALAALSLSNPGEAFRQHSID